MTYLLSSAARCLFKNCLTFILRRPGMPLQPYMAIHQVVAEEFSVWTKVVNQPTNFTIKKKKNVPVVVCFGKFLCNRVSTLVRALYLGAVGGARLGQENQSRAGGRGGRERTDRERQRGRL